MPCPDYSSADPELVPLLREDGVEEAAAGMSTLVVLDVSEITEDEIAAIEGMAGLRLRHRNERFIRRIRP
jgi:hypothetical protein